MRIILELLVLLFTTLVVNTSTSSEDIVQPTDLFSGFFPCLPNTSNISTQEDAQSCDLFVYAAVQLALEKVNGELDIRLSPIVLPSDSRNSNGVVEFLFNLYKTVSNLGKRFSRGLALMRAAIGTDNNYIIGRQALAIFDNIGIPIVSYGLYDDRVDGFPSFYRTIPSIISLNQARVKLLAHFKWYRIGILGSQQSDYSYEMEKFREFFNLYVEREIQAELSYEGLASDLSSSLLDLQRFDIRIIMGFFGPEESRLVLCEASFLNLTTSDHVWILPSYYNPDWWKGGDQHTGNCTDEDMMDILNSVIFIDPVKYPPMGTMLSEFYPALLNKTRELFSELDPEVPLERLLQHSRAVSAYDSTLLLAHSLSDEEINIRKLKSLIVCELCRLYPKCVNTEDEFRFCQYVLPMCQHSADSLELDETIGQSDVINGYGQVLISQFINGTHCPMVLFWPINSSIPEDLISNFVFINSLANQTCASELGLDPQIMFPDTAACPKSFTWKGGSAPISNVLLFNEVPEWALALVGVITVLSEVLIVCLIVFSVFWRENHRVKATSPRVNILILIGAALTLLYPLFQGILISGTRYKLDTGNVFASTLCQVNLWLPSVGYSLFLSGLVMKAFRLYRIYQNKSLRVKLYMLDDRYLILGAFVLIVPVLLILIIWNSISAFLFKKNYIENGNIQYIQVTNCFSNNLTVSGILYVTIRLYSGILFIAAIGLTLFVPRKAPKSIRFDVAMTRVALAIGFVLKLAASCAEVVLVSKPLLLGTVWWFSVLDLLVGTTLVVCALFMYQAVLVALDYIKKHGDICVVRKRRSETQESDTYYKSLLEQITELSDSLYEKEAAIRHLKAQKQVLNGTGYNVACDMSTF